MSFVEKTAQITTIPLSSITMSCEIDQLFTALSLLQGEMTAIKKENHGHRHRYADINTVLDHILPILAKFGLAVTQHPSFDKDGAQMLMTMLCHKSGQFMCSASKIVHDPSDIQSLGAGITYQRRYALVSILGIEQEDDDGATNKKVPAYSTPKKVTPEMALALGKKINIVDSTGRLLSNILIATKAKSLEDMTEKQTEWVISNYLKN